MQTKVLQICFDINKKYTLKVVYSEEQMKKKPEYYC